MEEFRTELHDVKNKLDDLCSKLDTHNQKVSSLYAEVEVLKSKMGTVMAIGGVIFAAIVTFIMGFFKASSS